MKAKVDNYLNEALQVLERARSIGYRELENGTRLYGNMTHIAPQAWLHQVFPPLNSVEIEALQFEIPTGIDEAYVNMLKLMNGLNIFSCSLSMFGLRKNFERSVEAALQQPFSLITPNTVERPRGAKREHLFIGSYFWDGSLIYVDCNTSKVYRCQRDNIEPLLEWTSIVQMLKSEVKRISEHFDNNGRQIDESRPTTP